MKPKHRGGYTAAHTDLCERALLTLLRGLGPWRESIFLIGGLVPKLLIDRNRPVREAADAHAGTMDVDLVIDVQVLTRTDAYRTLEQNLKAMGFERGLNIDGQPQHFSWRKRFAGMTVVVDLLCDGPVEGGGRVQALPGERRLSALAIPGAHLVFTNYVEVELDGELLEARGDASARIRVAGIVPFLVLKALAFEDRSEQKDAYDIVYALMNYETGPEVVAGHFAAEMARLPEETLLQRALEILRKRFASDARVDGFRKDGPVAYATFLADLGHPDEDAVRQRDAAAVVELFLAAVADAVSATTHKEAVGRWGPPPPGPRVTGSSRRGSCRSTWASHVGGPGTPFAES